MQLFNLENDPFEVNDLSTDSDWTDCRADLESRLLARQKELDDPLASR